MKTKLKIMGAAAIVATGCLIGISGSRTTESSAITLANVEALSRWEVSVEYDKCCVADSRELCVPNYMGPIAGLPVEC